MAITSYYLPQSIRRLKPRPHRFCSSLPFACW
ncbi:hypothetical protein HNQ77_000973 [Silvibacterium bohemicum]|uniref:Uncharacterized protein n=1 Tax=Silvibacterium bohemicum TaxID=1577686 RepID=A0A841JTG2_9BACT|nr:hypothetical protein [Silvibacterium bohemicum]